VELYFDDFKVTHTKSAVVQSNDYFAFGMDNSALSYQRENMIKNNFLYNAGSEQQVNVDANLYDMPYRGMDVSIGRMMQVDPMSDRYSSLSPYNYAFNNPVFLNDPGGASPYDDGFETGRNYGTLGATENIMPNTSLDDFVRNVRNSPYGGTWSSSGSSYLFQSSEQAFAYGAAYNDYHDSWANTEYGNYDKSLIAFQWIQSTGETPSIAIVNALSDGLSPDFMSMNACLTCEVLAQQGGADPDFSSDARSWQYVPVGPDEHYQATGVSGLYYDYITTYKDAQGKIRIEYVRYKFNTLYFEFPRVRADGSVISAMDAARLSAAAKDMAEEQVEMLLGGQPRPATSTLENTFLTELRTMLAPFGARVSLTPNYGPVPVTPYSKTLWGNGR